MPIGKNGQSPSASSGQDRPVVFQKYFKSGNRTYAAQIKMSVSGRKYLVLTEGLRDPNTQELKKHYVRVPDQDLKSFFSMLQEVVVYLRSTRNSDSIMGTPAQVQQAPVRPVAAAKPAPTPAAPEKTTSRSRTTAAAKPATKATPKAQAAKPAARSSPKPPVQVSKSTKTGYRATSRSR